jgi:hypothetical protein
MSQYFKLITGDIKDRVSPVIRSNMNLGPPNPSKFKESKDYQFNELSKVEGGQEEETTTPVVFFINEDNLSKCPQVGIVFSNGARIRAILDSGSEVNWLSEGVYGRRRSTSVTVRKHRVGNRFWKAL